MADAVPPVPARVRIIDTFLAPRRLAGHLSGSVPWLGILLISTAISVLSILAVPDEVFLEPMQNAVTRRGVPVEITSDPATVVRWGRLMSMLATLATHPIAAFVIAGVLTGLFTFLGRGHGSLLEYLSLVSHGLLIPALGTLIALAVQGIGGLVGSGEPGLTGGGVPSLPLGIDPFVVWMLVVVGIGTSTFDKRRGPWTATGILLAVYVGFLLITRVGIPGVVD